MLISRGQLLEIGGMIKMLFLNLIQLKNIFLSMTIILPR